MKVFYFFFLVFFLGCSSAIGMRISMVQDAYNGINFKDGISQEEAKVIAQHDVINKNFVQLYDFENPEIFADIEDLPYNQKYWFVSFKETQNSTIPFLFIVIIDKKNGKIKFADDYVHGKKWILEAVLLNTQK